MLSVASGPEPMNGSAILGVMVGSAITLAAGVIWLCVYGEIQFVPAVQALGSIAIAFSALTAYRLYLQNSSRNERVDARERSKTILDESIALLGRAFETFTRNGTHPPPNSRLQWLSTARMIIRFSRIKGQVAEPDHIIIRDENEEYYRLKFFTLLAENRENLDQNYFNPSDDKYHHEMVARNSIAVIFDFAKWPEGMEDPMATVDDIELFARGAVPIDFIRVENYLSNFQSYWEKIEARKAELNQDAT